MKTAIWLFALLAVSCSLANAQSCTQTFTPANVGTSPFPGSNVNTAVQNGTGTTVLCFSSGTYGTIDLFTAHPSGIVTIEPAAGAAATGLAFNLNGVSNLTVTGFSGTSSLATFEAINASVTSAGDTFNITVSNNHVIGGHIMIRDNQRANANDLITGNLITGFNAVGQGALQAFRNIGCPSGIVFQNNHAINAGGDGGDGIDTSGADCGTQFIRNEIEGVLQSTCPNDHCDGYQDFGGSVNEVVDSNYFHNDSDCILLNDGTTNITITNNVCVPATGAAFAMQLTGTVLTFKHNTTSATGNVLIGNTSQGQSTSFTETDNVFIGGTGMVLNSGQTIGGTGWLSDYNLCQGGCSGAHSISGTATFTGGATPSTYSGFALAVGSPGRGVANDGLDMGAIASPALVNSCVVGNEAATSSITTPSCVNTAGNFLIVTTTAVRPFSTITITDTVGDTFVNANPGVFPFHDSIQDGDVYVWYVPSAKGGSPNTFHTVPTSGSSALEIHVSEWTGMRGWVPDQTSVANGATGGTSFTSGSKTTTTNGELIFGYTFPLGNSTPGTGFTGITLVNGDWDEFKVQPTAGSAAATFTSDNSGTWLAAMQTFMASAGTQQVATPTFSPVAGTYGTAQTVTITSATASATICYTTDGTAPAANGAGTCTHGTTLANGGTVSVASSVTVQALGTLSGSTDSAVGSATYTIGIPVASLAPASLSFGGVNNSNTSAPQTLTLQNTGTAVMSITSISLTGANTGDFFQSNNCPVGSNLGNGSSCTITVTFTPLAVGARSASVSVADGASGSPHTSALSGTGVQASLASQINAGAKLSGKATLK